MNKKELGKEKERKGKIEEDKVITSNYKITRYFQPEERSQNLSRKNIFFEVLEDLEKKK